MSFLVLQCILREFAFFISVETCPVLSRIQSGLNYTVIDVGCTFCSHEDFQSGQTSSLFKKGVLLKDVSNGSLL